MCISCRDFLAAGSRDVALRTKSAVKRFPPGNGFNIVERQEPDFRPTCDQVWGYNIRFNKMRRPAS
jgi:hypothetical protein